MAHTTLNAERKRLERIIVEAMVRATNAHQALRDLAAAPELDVSMSQRAMTVERYAITRAMGAAWHLQEVEKVKAKAKGGKARGRK